MGPGNRPEPESRREAVRLRARAVRPLLISLALLRPIEAVDLDGRGIGKLLFQKIAGR